MNIKVTAFTVTPKKLYNTKGVRECVRQNMLWTWEHLETIQNINLVVDMSTASLIMFGQDKWELAFMICIELSFYLKRLN